MPWFKRTGMISHRHPFYGADPTGVTPVGPDPLAVTPKPPTPPAGQQAPTTWLAIAGPTISGGIMGLVSYGVCRTLEVDARKAKGVAVTMGFVTALGQVASGWLRGWVDKAVAGK